LFLRVNATRLPSATSIALFKHSGNDHAQISFIIDEKNPGKGRFHPSLPCHIKEQAICCGKFRAQ